MNAEKTTTLKAEMEELVTLILEATIRKGLAYNANDVSMMTECMDHEEFLSERFFEASAELKKAAAL